MASRKPGYGGSPVDGRLRRLPGRPHLAVGRATASPGSSQACWAATLTHTLPAQDIHAGAQIMYYGGDAIDAALRGTFFAQWYARSGRRLLVRRARPIRAWGQRRCAGAGHALSTS
jgi:putative membrane protein